MTDLDKAALVIALAELEEIIKAAGHDENYGYVGDRIRTARMILDAPTAWLQLVRGLVCDLVTCKKYFTK